VLLNPSELTADPCPLAFVLPILHRPLWPNKRTNHSSVMAFGPV